MIANDPIGVAVVGYGLAGQTFHAPLIAATPGLRLTAVVSSRPEAVHADLPDVEVLPDLDAGAGEACVGEHAPVLVLSDQGACAQQGVTWGRLGCIHALG